MSNLAVHCTEYAVEYRLPWMKEWRRYGSEMHSIERAKAVAYNLGEVSPDNM
jgi:hypothetical protein